MLNVVLITLWPIFIFFKKGGKIMCKISYMSLKIKDIYLAINSDH